MSGMGGVDIEENTGDIKEVDYVDKHKDIYYKADIICFVIIPDNCNSANFYKKVTEIQNSIISKYCKFLFLCILKYININNNTSQNLRIFVFLCNS
jgi:hypothetical protein